MLTGVLDGHITRLATPPEPRHNPAYQQDGAEESRYQRYHPHPRPPPVPRPRTLEGCDMKMSRGTYSPSLDANRRGASCERANSYAPPQCWCEEEPYEDLYDERHHHHRHSYHEGLHHAHEHRPAWPPQPRRPVSGRRSASPCCWHPSASAIHSIPLNDHYGGGASVPIRVVPDEKVGLDNSHRMPESDYIPLWRCHSPTSVEERLSRLEGDKETLSMQVSVLSDQVDAQQEKIRDLEAIIDEKKRRLLRTEDLLQKEVIAKTSLETQRLELLSDISNLKLHQAAFERQNHELREKLKLSEDNSRSQTCVSSPGSNSSMTSPSTVGQGSRKQQTDFTNRNNSHLPPRTPPSSIRRKIDHLGTIPRALRDHGPNGYTGPNSGAATMGRPCKGVAFGKGPYQFLSLTGQGSRSTSAPNLAETECVNENGNGILPLQDAKRTAAVAPTEVHPPPSLNHKPSGLRKIFTRLRRSSSGHLENDLADGLDFKRGGIRATAAARLGWTAPPTAFKQPDRPFTAWTATDVEQWLCSLGLSQYCAATRCWMESGQHISRATATHLEKDLGVRHPLHRKKLQLSISQHTASLMNPCHHLDSAWVLRWLDDLGLPQYKDAFSESRVDGLVLNYLTYDDLCFLRVSNLLHVTSLKRGVQVLREHKFDADILIRRSAPGEEKRTPCPSDVALWTNHRVMEWLKTVDLSEYAPNLRGSGVHGALLIYETRFTSELLASLLSISSSRTLLRRHLNTHFMQLVGKEVVQFKRDSELSPGYIPILISSRIKMPKKSQFSLKRRKTKTEFDFDDLLCPLDERPLKLSTYYVNHQDTRQT